MLTVVSAFVFYSFCCIFCEQDGFICASSLFVEKDCIELFQIWEILWDTIYIIMKDVHFIFYCCVLSACIFCQCLFFFLLFMYPKPRCSIMIFYIFVWSIFCEEISFILLMKIIIIIRMSLRVWGPVWQDNLVCPWYVALSWEARYWQVPTRTSTSCVDVVTQFCDLWGGHMSVCRSLSSILVQSSFYLMAIPPTFDQ